MLRLTSSSNWVTSLDALPLPLTITGVDIGQGFVPVGGPAGIGVAMVCKRPLVYPSTTQLSMSTSPSLYIHGEGFRERRTNLVFSPGIQQGSQYQMTFMNSSCLLLSLLARQKWATRPTRLMVTKVSTDIDEAAAARRIKSKKRRKRQIPVQVGEVVGKMIINPPRTSVRSPGRGRAVGGNTGTGGVVSTSPGRGRAVGGNTGTGGVVSPPLSTIDPSLCSNTCPLARNGICDDPRNDKTGCALGSDCQVRKEGIYCRWRYNVESIV